MCRLLTSREGVIIRRMFISLPRGSRQEARVGLNFFPYLYLPLSFRHRHTFTVSLPVSFFPTNILTCRATVRIRVTWHPTSRPVPWISLTPLHLHNLPRSFSLLALPISVTLPPLVFAFPFPLFSCRRSIWLDEITWIVQRGGCWPSGHLVLGPGGRGGGWVVQAWQGGPWADVISRLGDLDSHVLGVGQVIVQARETSHGGRRAVTRRV